MLRKENKENLVVIEAASSQKALLKHNKGKLIGLKIGERKKCTNDKNYSSLKDKPFVNV